MKTLIAAIVLIGQLAILNCTAQTITTIAGNGVEGHGIDGVAATASPLNYPIGVCADAAGNVYFTDQLNDRVRRVAPNGIMTTIAGGGTDTTDGILATNAYLLAPWGIAIDTAGNLFVTSDGVVKKITTSGIILTIAGNKYVPYGGEGIPATDANICAFAGISVDNQGNIYTADRRGYRVHKINTLGLVYTLAGNGYPGVAGIPGFVGDTGPATDAALGDVIDVNVDKYGNVYLADASSNKVRKVNTAGIISTFAGNGLVGSSGDGGPATAARINLPGALGIDTANNIYISDYLGRHIRKVTPAGIISNYVGNGGFGFGGDGGPATGAIFEGALGIFITKGDVMYISDPSTQRIRKIKEYPPHFIYGPRVVLTACPNATISLDTALAIIDSDGGQALSSSLVYPPIHGGTYVAFGTVSGLDTFVPSGVIYVPPAGFIGTDSFQVRISDGIMHNDITIVVYYPPLPVPFVTGGVSSGCILDTTTLMAGPIAGIWHSNNPLVATIDASGHVAAVSPGTAQLFYTINGGCEADSASRAFTVLPPPPSSVSITSSADTICSGSIVSFVAAPVNGGMLPVFQWYKNGFPVGSMPTYASAALADGDILTCSMAGNMHCAMPLIAHSNAKRVRVFNVGHPSLSLSYLPSVVCDGTSATITPHPTLGGPSPYYKWYRGGSLLALSPSVSYYPTDGDVISCLLESDDTSVCPLTNSVSASIILHTIPQVVPSVNITSSGNDSVDYLYEHVYFFATTTYGGSAPTYQWYENGQPVLGATSDSYDNWLTFNDTVYCTMTSNLECAATLIATSNTVTVKGNYLSVADEQGALTSVQLFPNPSKGTFHLIANSSLSETGSITVYNIDGATVKETTFSTNTLQSIMLDNAATGIYFIRLTSPHLHWNGKIVITE